MFVLFLEADFGHTKMLWSVKTVHHSLCTEDFTKDADSTRIHKNYRICMALNFNYTFKCKLCKRIKPNGKLDILGPRKHINRLPVVKLSMIQCA